MNYMYNIAIITTVRHNIGDDFVREGIIDLVTEAAKTLRGGDMLNFEFIHKHSPVSCVYGLERIKSPRLSRLLDPASRMLKLPDRIATADLLIQSGAPIYWCHRDGSRCENNEWYDPLIRKRYLRNRQGRKFFNLAGGSCQRYHADLSELLEFTGTTQYIAEFFDACDLTTLRDSVARQMLRLAGRDATVLPCTSIFARDRFQVDPAPGEYIVLNFMEGGGHFMFGQEINKEKWRVNFKKIVAQASKMGRVVVACHNQRERDLARQVAPDVESFLVPDDHVEFIKFYAAARFGIVNRVHAAFMLASFGKPAAVIGTDTRALMISNLGLPSYFVENITDVDAIVEDVAAREHSYAEEAEAVRATARAEYVALLKEAI